jgi:hypothetical protein
MEIVEWHSVSISSEDKEIMPNNNSGMSISSWWSLALVFGEICIERIGIGFKVLSLFDLLITFFETWVLFSDQERIGHRNKSWTFDFSMFYLFTSF